VRRHLIVDRISTVLSGFCIGFLFVSNVMDELPCS
jgi:hypothetical protein